MEAWKREKRLKIMEMLLLNKELRANNKLREKIKKLKTLGRSRAEEFRNKYYSFGLLLREMRISQLDIFYDYMRMTPENFEQLLSKIGPLVEKQSTNYKEAIPAAARLSMTLRYLVTGESMMSIAATYGIGKSTVVGIIPIVCEAIWNVLSPGMFEPSVNEWLKVSDGFEKKWSFPSCVGSLEAKHIVINQAARQEIGSSSTPHGSVILMAVVSSDFRFLIVDIGTSTERNDDHIFDNSMLGQMMQEKELDLPGKSPLSKNCTEPMPFVFVTSELFDADTHVMPFFTGNTLSTAELIFNFRASDARRASENAFGILASRWGIYGNIMNISTMKVEKIVKATVCLHNFLMPQPRYCEAGYADAVNKRGQIVEGTWRLNNRLNAAFADICRVERKAVHEEIEFARNYFAEHFINEGTTFTS